MDVGTPDVLMMGGGSFLWGAALSDDQTLAAAVSRITGFKIFNAGRMLGDLDDLGSLDWLIAKWPEHPRHLVYVYYEQFDFATGSEGGVWSRLSSSFPSIAVAGRQIDRMRDAALRSPTAQVSSRLMRWLSNDMVLPNGYARSVVIGQLPRGERIIFRDFELSPARHKRQDEDVRKTADYLAWLASEIAVRGIRTTILLLPSRYTVYGRYAASDGPEPDPTYLERLERELRSREVATVNSLNIFAESLTDELASGELSYYREDNHWTPAGVERVAKHLASVLN
jgi:hypothetical protein